MESTTASPQRGQTLVSLCKWWRDSKEEALPSICHQFVKIRPDKLDKFLFGDISSQHSFTPIREEISTWENFGTGRSISIAGILGGILFILIIIAFIICLRHRKRYQDQDRFLSYEMRQLHHNRTSQHLLTQRDQVQDSPPDYNLVIKLKEEEEGELPSYSQAVGDVCGDVYGDTRGDARGATSGSCTVSDSGTSSANTTGCELSTGCDSRTDCDIGTGYELSTWYDSSKGHDSGTGSDSSGIQSDVMTNKKTSIKRLNSKGVREEHCVFLYCSEKGEWVEHKVEQREAQDVLEDSD